jgi:hypothetical protein
MTFVLRRIAKPTTSPLPKEGSAQQRTLSIGCCFAVIALFSSLLFRPSGRQRARVSAAN